MYARIEWGVIRGIVSTYIRWTYDVVVPPELWWKELYVDENWNLREHIKPKKKKLTEIEKRSKKAFALWNKFFTVNRRCVVANTLPFSAKDVEKLYHDLIAAEDRKHIPLNWGHNEWLHTVG